MPSTSHVHESSAIQPLRARLHVLVGALLASALAISSAPRAVAQVDTPTARDTRDALRAVRKVYGSAPAWQNTLDPLALPDVERELCAGAGRAMREPLEGAASKLCAGAKAPFSDERFQKLAAALERRVAEIAVVPAEEWPEACRRAATSYQPVSEAQLRDTRLLLDKRLNDFQRRLPPPKNDNGWRAFLKWPQARALAAATIDKSLPLDELEWRWRAAPTEWNIPELVEASLAVQAYIPLLRASITPESAEEHAAAWSEIAGLLDARPVASADRQRLAELIAARERRGEATMLTVSIRREMSRPNIVLSARVAWLERLLSGQSEDPFAVNEVFGGSRSVGTGVMHSETRGQFLPSSAVGQFELTFAGDSKAQTVASSEGVTVRSNATTRLGGSKRMILDIDGLSARPAVVNAETSIVYESVNATGRLWRRDKAIQEAHARRPRAEADASASARRSTAKRLDEEGAKLVSSFNGKYRSRLQAWRLSPKAQTADVRLEATADAVHWMCCLESPFAFAAQSAPPSVDPPADLLLSVAASALEQQFLSTFGGRKMSGSELSEAIGKLLGESRSTSTSQDFSATFAARPCEARIAAGIITVRLFFAAFEAGGVEYPALTVDAQYSVGTEDGSLTLDRKESVHVSSTTRGDDQEAEAAGRQQTLRVAARRKFNKALPEKIIWPPPALSEPVAKAVLRIDRVVADQDWLQISLSGD